MGSYYAYDDYAQIILISLPAYGRTKETFEENALIV